MQLKPLSINIVFYRAFKILVSTTHTLIGVGLTKRVSAVVGSYSKPLWVWVLHSNFGILAALVYVLVYSFKI
jgi:phosphate/sulfate permease